MWRSGNSSLNQIIIRSLRLLSHVHSTPEVWTGDRSPSWLKPQNPETWSKSGASFTHHRSSQLISAITNCYWPRPRATISLQIWASTSQIYKQSLTRKQTKLKKSVKKAIGISLSAQQRCIECFDRDLLRHLLETKYFKQQNLCFLHLSRPVIIGNCVLVHGLQFFTN